MNTTINKKEEEKERKIEYIVVFLVLLFFLFLGLFNLSGYQSNNETAMEYNHLANNIDTQPKDKPSIVKKTTKDQSLKEAEALRLKQIQAQEEAQSVRIAKENALKTQALKEAEALRLKQIQAKEEAQRVRIAKKNALKAQALKEAEALRLKQIQAKEEAQRVRIAKKNALKAQALKEAEALRLKQIQAKEEAQSVRIAKENALKAQAKTEKIDATLLDEETSIINDINQEKVSLNTYILKGVYFETSSSQLTEKSARQINNIANALRQHNTVKIRLRGHTDNRGSKTLNLQLSLSRANAVKQALVAKGITAQRIATEGRESSQPISTNITPKGRLINRRVDIAVIQ